MNIEIIKNNRDKVGRFLSNEEIEIAIKNVPFIYGGVEKSVSPESNRLNLEKITHKFTDLVLDKESGTLTGKLVIFECLPNSHILNEIVKSNSFETTMSYTGIVDVDNNVNKLKIISIDIDYKQ